MEKILVIGGNAAGLTAASRAKRINPRLDVTVLEKLPQISYSTCGLPYMLSGVVGSEQLVSFTPEAFEKERSIKTFSGVRAESVVPGRKRVEAVRLDTGEELEFTFDRLLFATGVRPRVPDIPGTDLRNVFSIMNVPAAVDAKKAIEAASHTAIVGAGYAGLEFAESLRMMGRSVTIFEREPQVLSSIDPDMAQIVEYELRRYGVQVATSARVLALVGDDVAGAGDRKVVGVKSASSLGITPATVVLLDVGVEPNVELAREAGVQIGSTGGIAVDGFMETNVPGFYAAGNCAESYCLIRRKPVSSAIGTVAAKQGRVAGENLAGRRAKFHGSLGTTVLKVFDLAVACTGLTSRDAAGERMPIISARIEADDRAAYFPGARKIWVKLLVQRDTRKVVGAQAVGYGEAAKRVDAAAAAITGGLRVDDLAQLDLAYAPPYSNLWDPLLLAAQAVLRRL
jgi:NADPH-dependent 2,4-dienoyl-CoA reductase/sulfur reductase-like enzyme